MSICVVEGCGRPIRVKQVGLCSRCYQRTKYVPHPKPRMSDEEEKRRRSERARKSYLANKQKEKARYAKWAKENRDKRNAINKRWRDRNPEKVRAIDAEKRARLAQAPGTHTEQDRKALKERFNHTCPRCGTQGDLTIDHVIPIVLGGSNGPENLQPLCSSCNSAKRDREIFEYAPWDGKRVVTHFFTPDGLAHLRKLLVSGTPLRSLPRNDTVRNQ